MPTSAARPPSAASGWRPTRTAVERLLGVVGCRAGPACRSALAELRERHRRQLEAVRAGGARLEELRRRRAADRARAGRGPGPAAEDRGRPGRSRRSAASRWSSRSAASWPATAEEAHGGRRRPDLPEGVDPTDPHRAARDASWRPSVRSTRWRSRSSPSSRERHRFLEAQVEDVRRRPSRAPPGHPDPRRRDHARLRRGLRRRQRALLQPGHLALPGRNGPPLPHRPREPPRHRCRGRGPARPDATCDACRCCRVASARSWRWPTCSPSSGAAPRPST